MAYELLFMSPMTNTITDAKSGIRRSSRDLARKYSSAEKNWEFVIELVAFAIILAVSAWPMVLAAGALHNYLRGSIG